MGKVMWFDLETTGLDPIVDQVLEVGCVLTTGAEHDYAEVDSFHMVCGVSEDDLLDMDEVVRNMHKGTGLWDEVVEHGHDPFVVATEWLAWMDRNYLTSDVTVGGSGISRFDVPFVARWFPPVVARFHFRHLDVSSLRVLVRDCGRSDLIPPFDGVQHRALDDARSAVELARSVTSAIRRS